MKTLLIIAFTILFNPIFSQPERYTSIELDKLVWKKINQYRVVKGKEPFIQFEQGLMRDFSKRVANRNIDIYPTKHSDSIGYWNSAECLYTWRHNGSITFEEKVNDILSGDFEFIASQALTGWINSPTHEQAISRDVYDVATVFCIIIIDREKQSIRFDATFHAVDNRVGAAINGYKYIKKGEL
tara:strand:+ start:9408 stop:9959 length:552 start_codon:yes stop_codon:yes gene_type:complete